MLRGNENYTKNIEYLKDHSIWQVMIVNTQASTLKEKKQTECNFNFIIKVGVITQITGNYVNINVYLIDLSLLGPYGADETNYLNKIKIVRIPQGWRQTSWLCTREVEEMKQGLIGTNLKFGKPTSWHTPSIFILPQQREIRQNVSVYSPQQVQETNK